MSADLHIILIDPQLIDVELVKKYATFEVPDNVESSKFFELQEKHQERISLLYGDVHDFGSYVYPFKEDVWVGQVSWLKASLSGEYDRYVPSLVAHVSQTYFDNGGAVVITDEFIESLLAGYEQHHETPSIYEDSSINAEEHETGVTRKETLEKFLRSHLGEWSFADSW